MAIGVVPVDGDDLMSAQEKRRVLVVDDYEDNRAMLQLLLQASGMTVFEAKNGREAIDMACLKLPDVILMDLSMPIMDGFEATRRLKDMEHTKAIPVIAVSAHCHEANHHARAIEAGCIACMHKPLEWPKFMAFLENLQQ